MEDSAKIGRASLNGGAAPQSGESGDPIVDWTASGTARWMIDASGCLVIAPLEGGQSGELGKWDDYHTPWYDYRSSITSAKIEGQIAVSTARSMFLDCRSLESLDLSGLDTSSATNMSSMFWGCSSLKSLDLSGLDTSSVEGMCSMFLGCFSLESLDLSGLDTSSVEGMTGMFEGCSSLKSLDLSGLDTTRVTGMSGMFRGCSSLESLGLSGLDTSSATGMSGMFRGCSSLESLDLSGLDTSSATDMSYMFRGCSSLESLDLSGFDTSSVLYIRDMFDGCSGLRTVTLGEEFSFADIYADECCYLPTPQGKNLTGKWLSSADGKARAREAVSGHVAATYTAQVRIDISDAVISG